MTKEQLDLILNYIDQKVNDSQEVLFLGVSPIQVGLSKNAEAIREQLYKSVEMHLT